MMDRATEPTDEEIARGIADTIIRDVAELPDRTSPEYDGDVMLVTADELRQIVMHPLTEALRSVRAEEREKQWQPIETAPTNTSILVWVPRYWHYGPGVIKAILVDMGTGRRWHSTGWHVGRDIAEDDTPLYWMPLPTPPAAIRETDSDA